MCKGEIAIPPLTPTSMGRRRNKRKNENEIKIPPAPPPPPLPPPPPPPWIELPEDVTSNILQRLGAEDILESAQKVCTTWRKVCKDPAMWRVITLKNRSYDYCKFDQVCRFAVDRSQGQMAELCISSFGDDELLNYVALRCSHLRCLVLANPSDVSPLALTDAVKKLPQLEALHLINTSLFDPRDVENIGTSCPLLKSFTYKAEGGYGSLSVDENAVALAIAKTMPNLHHLCLVGDMENEGLEAILDGCPHLELLDLRHCYSLDLEAGALVERCSKQIKDLRLPIEPSYDSDDYYDDGGLDYRNSDNEYGDDYYY